jgi:hypothetical protein
VTQSTSIEVYTPESIFAFARDPAIEALKPLRKVMAFCNRDALLEGSAEGRVHDMPDEVAFATQRVGLYFK